MGLIDLLICSPVLSFCPAAGSVSHCFSFPAANGDLYDARFRGRQMTGSVVPLPATAKGSCACMRACVQACRRDGCGCCCGCECICCARNPVAFGCGAFADPDISCANFPISSYAAPGFIFEEDDNRTIDLDADAADKEPTQQTIWKVRSRSGMRTRPDSHYADAPRRACICGGGVCAITGAFVAPQKEADGRPVLLHSVATCRCRRRSIL